jgi:hypothetical protein
MMKGLTLSYSVDLVLVIDATGSMAPIVESVKFSALSLFDDLEQRMNDIGKHVDSLRVRVVAYRDFYADSAKDSLITSDFFRLPDQRGDFADFLHDIRAAGGGDEPETGLEALAEAIRSGWARGDAKQRQIIVLWTDASAHALERNRGAKPDSYPAGMPADLDELTDLWDGQASPVHVSWKRLLLYSPDVYPWTSIADNWEQTLHFTSKAGQGLADKDYEKILDAIARAI